jgi:hypothetical protein
MGRMKAPVAERAREAKVARGGIKVMPRPAKGDPFARLTRPARTIEIVPFPPDAGVAVTPFTISLPAAPDGLVMQMDEHGDGHLYLIGEDRMSLGSDGMWWIVTRIVEALEDPQTISEWPRFLTLGGTVGGPAVQASLQYCDDGVCLVWRRLQSGLTSDLLGWQEFTADRAQVWLKLLKPLAASLESQNVHQNRLIAARTAERWAYVLERGTRPASGSFEI